MIGILFISLSVGLLSAGSPMAAAVTPASSGERAVFCYTTYVGAPGDSVYRAENWSHGFPRPGHVVCVPEELEDEVARALPAGADVRVMPPAGSTRVSAAAGASLARRNPPAPTTMGACCVGSTCQTTDAFDCRELGGYFLEGLVECFGAPCATGACCREDHACVDDDGMGGDMDEDLCSILDGTYLGGAACDDDPCERFRVPEGFQIVEASSGDVRHGAPRLNNCGEIVQQMRAGPSEIYHYDNGVLTQLTNDDLHDMLPDINDHGAVVWVHRLGEYPAPEQVVHLHATQSIVLTEGGEYSDPRLNNRGHVTWVLYVAAPCPPSEYRSDVYFYDARAISNIYADGYSNQGLEINDHDQLAWTRYEFPCGGGLPDWTSQIRLRSGGTVIALPSNSSYPQEVAIDNIGRVAWYTEEGAEVWQNGQTLVFSEGNNSADNPALNDLGDIAFNRWTASSWQLWLYRNEEFIRISSDLDIENGIDNHSAKLNSSGEIVWKWVPNAGLTPSGTRYMRRIRNGDVDFDGDRDMEDFARFPGCWTGPDATDGLCECRFLDIDHDRDVDDDDLDLFLRVYTGPLDDCNGNEILDLRDLVDGTCRDCNLNGIPDECDVSAGYSQDLDGDGMPDECCSAAPPQTDTLGPKNRYLTFVPENVALTAFAPPGGMGKDDGGQCPPYVDTSPLNKGGLRGVVGPEEGSAVRSTSTNDDGGQCPPYASGLRGVDRPFVKHGPRGRLTTGQLQALRVTFIDLPAPYDALNGTFMWVGEPKEVCENSGQGDDVPLDSCGRAPGQVLRTMWTATLQCEPHYTDWTQYPAPIHIEDEAIVPYGTYALQRINADCATATPANYSDPLTIRTSRWGDLVKDCTVIPCGPPDGVVNITTDVTAVLDKFKNLPGAVGKVRADLEPARVDQRINITDVVKALDAFVGFAYPFVSVPDPCPP